MADWDQILQPAFVRSLDQRDDVALLTLPKNDLAVRRSRTLFPSRLTRLMPLFLW
jgi:hypothetical protein